MVAVTKKGTEIRGQHKVGNMKLTDQRPELKLDPAGKINPKAYRAIMEADVIVVAPGNLYGSLAPALLVDGVTEALKMTKAKIACVTNLVTKPGQTDDFTVTDMVDELQRFMGAELIQYVIYNTDEPTKIMLEKYVRDGEYMVEFDLDDLETSGYISVGLPLIDKTEVELDPNDSISHVRSLIRHNSDAVAREIMKIYFS